MSEKKTRISLDGANLTRYNKIMMSNTNTATAAHHPDFRRTGETLTAKQVAWLAANGIEAVANHEVVWSRGMMRNIPRPGHFFTKGHAYVCPIMATDSCVWVYSTDADEDGEHRRLGTFDTLREALRFVAALGIITR